MVPARIAKLLFPFTSKNTDFDAGGKFLARLVAPDEVNCELFDGAVEEQERCDEEKLNDRIWLMKRIISDFWNKDKARSTN